MGNEQPDVGMSCSTYDKYMSAFKINSKGKVVALQAWIGTEGSRKLRLTNFKTICTWRYKVSYL